MLGDYGQFKKSIYNALRLCYNPSRLVSTPSPSAGRPPAFVRLSGAGGPGRTVL